VVVATDREYGLFIGGEVAEPASGDVRALTEPATGELLARAAMAGEAEVDRAVEAARAAVEGDWGRTPGTERSRLLHALADAIVANRTELAELEARNVGKAISSVKAELHQAVENFRYYGSAIATISGRSNPIGGSLLFYSSKEPVGVAAQIVPWNYPLMMATWKLAPALAAGCSVVLKPDPLTPLTAIRLAELAAEVGFPVGAVNVVPVERGSGDGAEVLAGGVVPDGPGAFYPPTVVAAANDAEIAQEEVFGPVVTVIPFEDEKDAIRIANDVRYGLMATIWTGDPARGHRIAARIKSGTVGINMPYTAFPGIPFGGYKQSGFGRELALETLDLYLETKSVIVSTGARPINPFGL